jgi:hypothetical protein
MTLVYRVQQGVRALFAFSQPIDYDLAAHYLSTDQMTLFRGMAHSEQLHSLNVLRSVLAQAAETPHDLMIAALLHDCGKGHYALAVWQRTLAVLVEKLVPALSQYLSRNDSYVGLTFWRAPFVVRRHHPAWSAALLAQTETTERAIWLVAHHADSIEKWQGHPYTSLLERLKRADDSN